MRRLQLFGPVKNANMHNSEQQNAAPELPSVNAASVIPGSVMQAEAYLHVGKKVLEPLLKDPARAFAFTPDVAMALVALKKAAEIYEKHAAWDDAIFAWSMIKAVPIDPETGWNAHEQIERCQEKKRETQAAVAPRFRPKPPGKRV